MIRFAALFIAAVAFGQAPTQYTIEVAANGMRFADGPVWSLEDFLLFSDTVTDTQHKFTPGKGVSDLGSRPGGTAGNAYDEKGSLYTCEFRERRVTRTAKNGKVEVIAARFEGKRLNAPNDVVVRRDGNVYFTDPAFGNQEDTRELDFNGVFRVTPRGQVEAVAKWKTRPNGLALSPNGRTLYVSDSDGQSIHAFDLDRAGVASNDRVVVSKIPVFRRACEPMRWGISTLPPEMFWCIRRKASCSVPSIWVRLRPTWLSAIRIFPRCT